MRRARSKGAAGEGTGEPDGDDKDESSASAQQDKSISPNGHAFFVRTGKYAAQRQNADMSVLVEGAAVATASTPYFDLPAHAALWIYSLGFWICGFSTLAFRYHALRWHGRAVIQLHIVPQLWRQVRPCRKVR